MIAEIPTIRPMSKARSISLSHYRLAGEVADYIRMHCLQRDQLSLTHLSRQFGTCATNLKKSFKYRHGVSVHQYILSVRMDLAKQILQKEAIPAKELAWDLGYTDAANFARDFKKVVGCTVGEWVRELREPGMKHEIMHAALDF